MAKVKKSRNPKAATLWLITHQPTFLSPDVPQLLYKQLIIQLLEEVKKRNSIIVWLIASERHHARSAINTIQAEHSVVTDVRAWSSISEICDNLQKTSYSIVCRISPRCS